MIGPKAIKRVREEEVGFWNVGSDDTLGEYIKVKLVSGKPIKEKGWHWVQACIRGILGGQEKVAKANFLGDGTLLIKTQNETQTSKILGAHLFGEEECVAERDQRLNQSKGVIHAPDLLSLSEEEVCHWLKPFGVAAVRRFTKKVGDQTQPTPTLLLTFSKPACPPHLELDYVRYQVRKFIPNPLICHNCGKYGHGQDKCTSDSVCLKCAGATHEGPCDAKCVNCNQVGHSCGSKQCETWKAEREICEIKVEKDV